MLGGSLGSTGSKSLGYDEGIKLGSTSGKLFANILENIDGITLDLDIGAELGFLYGSFDFSNVGNLKGSFLRYSLVSTDGKLFVYDKLPL